MAAAIRKSRRITIEDIAHSTKISPMCLRAIERGQWKVLPGGVYDISYIKQYAKAIDFDPDALLGEYRRARGLARGGPARPEQSRTGIAAALRRFTDFIYAVLRRSAA